MKKYLMIHKFKEEYLEYDLDNYILTFDDGLYNHYLWYQKILKKFPNIQMYFFISTGIIHDSKSIQHDLESCKAHEKYFLNNDTSAFLSLDQIKEMSLNKNISIGLHGHKHINIDNKNYHNWHKYNKFNLKEKFDYFKNDCLKMLEITNNCFLKNKIIDKNIIYYCTPYNQYKELEISILKKVFKENIKNKTLKIIGPNRTNIENIKGKNNAKL